MSGRGIVRSRASIVVFSVKPDRPRPPLRRGHRQPGLAHPARPEQRDDPGDAERIVDL
jgi:hypothetical protein